MEKEFFTQGNNHDQKSRIENSLKLFLVAGDSRNGG